MKTYKRWIGVILAITLLGCTGCTKSAKQVLDPKNPTTITIWNYYNGDQLTAFDNLVSEFNSTVGIEKGIAVVSTSQGSIDNLAESLLDAANEKVGAQDLPNLAAIYAETAYILNQKDLLVNFDDYFTKDELAAYVPEFIEEGRLHKDGNLLLFPVSKSTECFVVNTTDWVAFEDATGISYKDIDSYESLVDAAEKYYEWTDSLTADVPEDGKALYGRDSVANYIYIGTAQLGNEMFAVDKDGVTVNLDRDTFKTLWDNYYIPFINGYFTAEASYRSEDMKTGAILASTGSTSGVNYMPVAVTDINDVSHDIEIAIENPLTFKDGEKVAVQQGAGYCALKATEAEQYAAAEFLKWFTESDRNLQFSVSSGYSAVTLDANKADKLEANFTGTGDTAKDANILNALLVSADVYMNEKTFTNKPFEGSKEVRDVLADALTNVAVNDRQAVVSEMEQGKSREEAVASYATDEYFDEWYAGLCDEVAAVVKSK